MRKFLNIPQFKGIHTNEANPAPDTASFCKNVVRDRVSGTLRSAPGYAPAFDMMTPQSDQSNLSVKALRRLPVQMYGGKDVDIVAATYDRIVAVFSSGRPGR